VPELGRSAADYYAGAELGFEGADALLEVDGATGALLALAHGGLTFLVELAGEVAGEAV